MGGDTYAILALRRKRARLAGEIEAAERVAQRQREALATLDAVIRVFEPASNPELIPAIRPRSARNLFFRRGEAARLCLAALHQTGAPCQARRLVDFALAAKGLDLEGRVRTLVDNLVRQTLIRMEHKGQVRKIVTWPDVWWELADDVA